MGRGDASDPIRGAEGPRRRDELAPPKLRRGLLGYRRSDVAAAISVRDAALVELREDVAALWLAFAEHDRRIGSADSEPARPATVPAPQYAVQPHPLPPTPLSRESDSATVEQQLSDLDDVLSAIETATKTFERTYADELATPDDGEGEGEDDGRPGADSPGGESA